MKMARPRQPTEEDIDNDLLIDEVEVRVLLYDKSHPDYNNVTQKIIAWEEIGEEVFHPQWNELSQLQRTEACKCLQKRWKNIRACFSRELREQRSEQAALAMGRPVKKRRKYLHFERLQFLLRTLEASDETSENDTFLPVMVEVEEEENEAKAVATYDVEENSREPTLPRRKKRKVEQKTTTCDEEQLNISVNRQEVADSRVHYDQEMNFALSLVPLLKALPKGRRLPTEIGILQLIQKETIGDGTMD